MPVDFKPFDDGRPSSVGFKPFDLGDASTIDIKDGRVARTHPSRMSDDDIATRILGMDPEDWAKAKASNAYRIASNGGKKQVLANAFTDPEGWWGSYVVGKNKDTPGASINRGIQSLLSGGKRALLAGDALVGKLVSKLPGQEGNEYLQEALLRAEQANQNINKGRQPGRTEPDVLHMAGQGLVANTLVRGNPEVGAGVKGYTPILGDPRWLERIAVSTPRNALETIITTPGSNEERLAAGATAAAMGNAIESVPAGGSLALQKLMGVTKKQKGRAAARTAALEKLNDRYGTNMEMTAGQLSGNPAMQKLEGYTEDLPFGLTGHRVAQNEQALGMARGYRDAAHAEMNAAPFSSENSLIRALQEGGLENGADPARILALQGNSAGNPNMVAEASRQGVAFDRSLTSAGLRREAHALAGDARINVDNMLSTIDRIRANGAAPEVIDEINRIEPMLREIQISDGQRLGAPQVQSGPGQTRMVVGPRPSAVGGVDPFTGVRLQTDLEFGGNPSVVSSNQRVVDPIMGASNIPANDGGLGLRSGETWVGPRMSITNTKYGNIDAIAARLGELAEESAGKQNDMAAKQFGILRRTAKSELGRHAEETGNTGLSLAQRKADEFFANQVVPVTNSKFSRSAANASQDGQESLLRRFIFGENDGRQKWLTGAVDEKGGAAARAYIADTAFDAGTVGRDYLSNAKFASILENQNLRPFFTDDQWAELVSLADIQRAAARSGQVEAPIPQTGAKMTPLQLISSPVTAPLGIAGQGLFATKVGKELLLGNPANAVYGPFGAAGNYFGSMAGQRWGGSNPTGTEEYY